MTISKRDMAARAARAAQSSPSIDDRLSQAREMVSEHPIDETLAASQPVSSRTDRASMTNGAQLMSIPLDLIDENPFNARRIYRLERIAEMSASIAASGQRVPGESTIRNGRYILAAGHYRFRALKRNSAKVMDLLVVPGLTDQELYAHSYIENAEREGQTALDNAISWRELLDRGVYRSEKEISDVTGISTPNVNKTLAALRLTEPVLDVVKDDPSGFALSVLYELVLYEAVAGQAKAFSMARSIGAGETSRRDLIEARTALEQPKERKRKENSRQYKIQIEGVQLGFIKEWDSGKVAVEVQLVDPKRRSAFLEELKRQFNLSEATNESGGEGFNSF